jgi:D-alanyl-lipoteichoic acid acyltransferase DltB (MBOAT superfamily)
MLFTSSIFLFLFLPVVLSVYHLLLKRRTKIQNFFLFVSSIFFYAWGEPVFVMVLLLSIIMNWFFGLLISKDQIKGSKKNSYIVITVMLIFNLTIIFIFKYLMFFLTNLNMIEAVNIGVPEILLPIGISFFTFQAISYVIDIYRGHGEVQKNPVNVGLYISFFPQLIAGPIVRYETIAAQISVRTINADKFTVGVKRFIIGFGKKMIIANSMAMVADTAFGIETSGLSVGMAWLGAIAYTMQIYYDFSGYSDKTWLLVLERCLVLIFLKISTTLIFRNLYLNSGEGGIYHWELGFVTTYIFPWVEAE